MPFDILIKQNATVDDTLRLIVNAVNVCSKSPFVGNVVAALDPSDKLGFTKRLFDYVCRNGKYELDTVGVEEVWTPEKTIRTGKFDCKKAAVLLGSVLEHAGFNPVLKHVFYSGPDGTLKDYTHIYVIVPNPDLRSYITMDPTNDCKYNTEVESSKQTLYFLNGTKMDLHMMGAAPKTPVNTQPIAPDTSCFTSQVNNAACKLDEDFKTVVNTSTCGRTDYKVDMIGLKNEYFSYTAGEAIKHGAAVAVLFVMRGAFLGLLYLGKLLAKTPLKLHLAARLAAAWQKDPNLIRKWWWINGGDKDANALKTAIIKGSGVTIQGPDNYGWDQPWIIDYRTVDQTWGGNQTYAVGEPITLATAAAALAAATPLILGAKALMKQLGVFKEGDTDAAPTDTAPPAGGPPAPGGGHPPGGIPVPPGGVPVPDGLSFATQSIDNFSEFLNFCKASGCLILGAQFHPTLIVPTNIIVCISLIYALRNQIQKFTSKFSIS